ncbi:PAS domain-containing sensor histidine kinase [Lutibacter sp.]|uniref:PAS domain-containing sensor histidine kinase n=1 Tax=Lutibacter sp. TaxID=1925666 RepID=UPI0027363F98|nr:PAS domain-containing sensor histidine kinase [Lutibacter sp.]MDP3313255.1 PAS domain-containing sensor histidine kinase [Lutibacter sp.]
MMLTVKKAFYKVCFDSMKVGILVFDKSQEIVLANEPFYELIGYHKNELIEKNISSLFKNNQILINLINDSLKLNFNPILETIIISKQKDEIPVEVIFGTILYKNQTYYKILITNISFRKKQEQKISKRNYKLEKELAKRNFELEQAIAKLQNLLQKEVELNQLKTKFISLTTHEFKTPLSGILSSAELLLKYANLNNHLKQNEHALKIKALVTRLNTILDDLLTLENIESGNINTTYSQFNLTDLCYECIENLTPLLKKNQVIRINSDVTILFHDAKILTIIITNLLYNAIKYSNENRLIKLKIRELKKSIIFYVIDQGIGIPLDEQNWVFNRFFRAKNAIFYPGTGIGLNIVKGYVTKLKGNISFKSVENEGTTFKIKLPKLISK